MGEEFARVRDSSMVSPLPTVWVFFKIVEPFMKFESLI
jgi:hypothetical protein